MEIETNEIRHAIVYNRKTGKVENKYWLPGTGIHVHVHVRENATQEIINKIRFEKVRQILWVDGYNLVTIIE